MFNYPTAPALSARRYAVSIDGPEELPYLSFRHVAESVDPDTASVLAALAPGQSYRIGPVCIRRIFDRGKATH